MGIDFSVRHNVEAMFAHRQASLNNTTLTKALERLSSGYRINRASDDAAGLAVSERLRTQVRGLQQAGRNIQDGMSLIQVAEAGLTELTDILQRVRELSLQAANGTYSVSDRTLIQLEIDQLLNEINRSMTTIEFNKIKLLNGTLSTIRSTQTVTEIDSYKASAFVGSMVFHVGANKSQTFSLFISTMSVRALGLMRLFSSSAAIQGTFRKDGSGPVTEVSTGTTVLGGVLSRQKIDSAIAAVDSALSTVSKRRAILGAVTNRLEHSMNFVGIATENMQAAESRIRDTDMASEVINFTKAQVLVQASQAMLAQANLKPTSILQLLA